MIRRRGYILLESVVAMGVLSVGIVGINASLRQVLLTRALAEDFTRVRFYLDELVAAAELRYPVTSTEESGSYGEESRFRWSRKIELYPIPIPPLPVELALEEALDLQQTVGQIAKVTVRVDWTRMGSPYSRRTVSFLPAEQVFVFPDEALMPEEIPREE